MKVITEAEDVERAYRTPAMETEPGIGILGPEGSGGILSDC